MLQQNLFAMNKNVHRYFVHWREGFIKIHCKKGTFLNYDSYLKFFQTDLFCDYFMTHIIFNL